MARYIVCNQPLPPERVRLGAVTCGARACHEAFVMRCESEFGTHKRVANTDMGKVHLVPLRDIIERGVKGSDLKRYPEVEPTPEEAIQLEAVVLRRLGVKAVEKEGRQGVELGGVFIPAGEPEEGEEAAFICTPVTQPPGIPGCVKGGTCMECGVEVWLAPTSQELKKRRPDMKCICLFCFLKEPEEEQKEG